MALAFNVASVNPYGDPNPPPSGFDLAIKNADAISNLFAKRQQGRIEQTKANLAEQTLGSEIAAKNAAHRADEVYYPLQQLAKLQHERAQIKHIQAQTGLTYAQAKTALSQAKVAEMETQAASDPGYQFKQLGRLVEQSAPNSPERAYYISLRNALGRAAASGATAVAGGVAAPGLAGFASKSGRGKTGSKEAAAAAAGLDVNPLQAGTTRGGKQAVAVDPATGEEITIESPTPASSSRGQLKIETEAEQQILNPLIQKGLANYRGLFPEIRIARDAALARGKGKEAEAARKRLTEYQTARSLISESSALSAKLASGQNPGTELLHDFMKPVFASAPSENWAKILPKEVQDAALANYYQTQKELADVSLKAQREGYKVEGQNPIWNQQQADQNWFDAQGNFITPEQRAVRDAQQQQIVQQKAQRLQYLKDKAKAALAAGKDPQAVAKKLNELAAQEGLAEVVLPGGR